MSDILHPIVDIAIELFAANEEGELVLNADARSALIDVINDLDRSKLPKALFALSEFSEMVRTRHQSPEGAEQLLQIAELYLNQLEQISNEKRSRRMDALTHGNKFLGMNSSPRFSLNTSAPKSVMNLRDVVQNWRGVINC
jgi:hypothetical protein